MSFDGDAYVEVPNSNSLNLLDELTIEAWIKLSSTDQIVNIIVKKASIDHAGEQDGNYYLYVRSHNEIAFYFDGAKVHQTSELDLQKDKWYHVAATFSDLSNEVKIYLDGNIVYEEEETADLQEFDNSLKIGRGGIHQENFHGIIDEVRIYNYAKTQAQIQEDMRKCTPSTPTAAAGPTPTTPAPTSPSGVTPAPAPTLETPTVTPSITECDSTARAIINAVGGCDALDKSRYPAIYEACCKITKEYLLDLLNDALADDGKITSDEKKQLLDALNAYLEMRP